MHVLARAGRTYWRENARAFQAIKVTVERDLPSALSIAAVALVASFLGAGFQVAALIIAGGSVTVQVLRWAVGR
ncbi:hypothetical protein GTY67_13190 [Streptomyces sp. SID8374]|uniref:hypothetical protein n=1 Tax=Streptomyces sp. SID8374 TaxID=2690354 RepID=UPI00136BDC4F|nr:hypothetical protein [Streptomyces sp. SID8374]MYX14351.1 hypothetical protein [Streptomyces sp. SID8374]